MAYGTGVSSIGSTNVYKSGMLNDTLFTTAIYATCNIGVTAYIDIGVDYGSKPGLIIYIYIVYGKYS